MSEMGHSLQIVAHRKSLRVRCSPKATQSQSLGICRAKGHVHQIADALNARGDAARWSVVRAVSQQRAGAGLDHAMLDDCLPFPIRRLGADDHLQQGSGGSARLQRTNFGGRARRATSGAWAAAAAGVGAGSGPSMPAPRVALTPL
jgi:hypothetical protein